MDSGSFFIHSLATRRCTAKSPRHKAFFPSNSLSAKYFVFRLCVCSVCSLCSRVYASLCTNFSFIVMFNVQYFVFNYIKQMCFSAVAMAKQFFFLYIFITFFFHSFHIGSLFCKLIFNIARKKEKELKENEEEKNKKNAQTEGLVLG